MKAVVVCLHCLDPALELKRKKKGKTSQLQAGGVAAGSKTQAGQQVVHLGLVGDHVIPAFSIHNRTRKVFCVQGDRCGFGR